VDPAAVADRVRTFYDRHPYPPPIDDLEDYRRRWEDPWRRRADHHLCWPARPFREDPSILVAGCGTSQAAKHALRWPAARVTGVDFSATAVRRTEALKRKYELANLAVHQLALEQIGELAKTFDLIVCTGVLHHLADPVVGLRALRSVLAPGGVMHLMVYAPYGRTGVYMFQELCRMIDLGATADEIGDLGAALGALPPTHPLAALAREAPDFRDPAGIADALLHPQDRAYAVPQLFDLLARGGCRFVRWLRQAPYSPHCGVMRLLPHHDRLLGLSPPQQYAAAELYRGTMVRHSAIVGRDDDAAASTPVVFTGDTWFDHVPLPAPDALAIRDGLPAGAAAVLVNRAHTYRDLWLPLDEPQLRLYDEIDGERSAGEIARIAGMGDEAAILFERLHLHDQVIFDISRSRAPEPDPGRPRRDSRPPSPPDRAPPRQTSPAASTERSRS
jgi:SAM-dependent methyltransferase